MEDTGKDFFHDSGKTLRFMTPNDAPKLHQGLTEPGAIEAQGKRQSTPNQLTGFKVYLKIPQRDKHFFFFYRAGTDFPYGGLAIFPLKGESGQTSPLGPGGKTP